MCRVGMGRAMYFGARVRFIYIFFYSPRSLSALGCCFLGFFFFFLGFLIFIPIFIMHFWGRFERATRARLAAGRCPSGGLARRATVGFLASAPEKAF